MLKTIFDVNQEIIRCDFV